MTADELKVQFSEGASAARTAADIREAIANIPAGGAEEIADYINVFCRARGIDPQAPEIQEYYQQSEEYKEKERENKARAETKATAAKIKELATNVENQIDTAPLQSPDFIAELAAINKHSATLGGNARTKKPFVSFAEYKKLAVNQFYWKEYRPDLFNQLPFPDGTVSLIGARSGAGKTVALVNLCRDIITTETPLKKNTDEEKAQEYNASRRVIFISREMSIEKLYNRLVMSTVWAKKGYRGFDHGLDDLKWPDTEYKINKTFREMERSGTPSFSGPEYIYNHVLTRYIEPAVTSERLIMYDALDAESLEEIIETATTKIRQGRGDVVLIDYAQILPSSKEGEAQIYGTQGDNLRIRYIMQKLRITAKETGAVLILAAQLNRQSVNNGKADETSFKDSADLEQTAHSAVIIERKDAPGGADETLSYKVVKARSSNHLGQEYNLQWIKGFQYMDRGERKTTGGSGKTAGQSEQIKSTDFILEKV
jgi:hypothetical protein